MKSEDLTPTGPETLETLRRYGLEWDGEVVYQSRRTALYQRAMERLDVFECACSRADLQRAASCTCRNGLPPGRTARAIRFRAPDETIAFDDIVCGRVEEKSDDFVVKQADGVFAYQLAVVVDDAEQRVTQVVRGADLLASTARLVGPDGSKLGKRDGALPLPALDIPQTLALALSALGLKVSRDAPEKMLSAALERFDPAGVPKAVCYLLAHTA